MPRGEAALANVLAGCLAVIEWASPKRHYWKGSNK
jgi:hypothetical protein